MTKKMAVIDSQPPQFATLDEIREAYENLTQTQTYRIEKYARSKVRLIRTRMPSYTHQDLIGEAFLSVLAGGRNWDKGKMNFVKFFIGVMWSVSGHVSRDEEPFQIEEPKATEEGKRINPVDDVPAPNPGALRAAEARQHVEDLLEPFADDQHVLNYVESIKVDFTQKESEEYYGMTSREYDAARKRLARKLRKYER